MQEHISKFTKRFEGILFWAVILILMMVPLYMKFPLFWIKGSLVSVRLEDIVIFITFLIWGIYLIVSKKYLNFFKSNINLTILVFFVVVLISVFTSSFLIHTTQVNIATLHFLRRVELILLLPLVISVTREKRQVHLYLLVMLISLILVNLYALGQRYLHFPTISTINAELAGGIVYFLNPGDRVNSTFAGHYDLAVYLMMAITVLTAFVFYYLKRIKNIFNLRDSNVTIFFGLGILSLLSFVILILTAARLSFFAVVVGVLTSIILVGKKRYIVFLLIGLGLIMLYPSQLRDRFVSTVKINILQNFSGYTSQTDEQKRRSELNIPTIQIGKDEELEVYENAPDITPGEPTDATSIGIYRSLNIRLNVEWPRAIRALTKNPLLGTGYSSIGLATDNDVLRSLGEVGILGTWAFVLILIAAYKKILIPYKKLSGFTKFFTAGVIAMSLSFILNSLLIDVFEASKVAALFWMILGMDIALIGFDLKNYEKN